jgi:hypothetical protein
MRANPASTYLNLGRGWESAGGILQEMGDEVGKAPAFLIGMSLKPSMQGPAQGGANPHRGKTHLLGSWHGGAYAPKELGEWFRHSNT